MSSKIVHRGVQDWLLQNNGPAKGEFVDLASEEKRTPGHIAREIEIIPQRLNDFCHRFWGITAGEVIRRVQAGKELPSK
ncbi:MAG: hypothetical protein IIV16_04420 [Alistipes sp.]|nr:hypothetical protein [Alistipes sp.]